MFSFEYEWNEYWIGIALWASQNQVIVNQFCDGYVVLYVTWSQNEEQCTYILYSWCDILCQSKLSWMNDDWT